MSKRCEVAGTAEAAVFANNGRDAGVEHAA